MTGSAGSNLFRGYLVVLAAAGALYIATMAPTVLWQDSGMYQYRILHNDIEGNLGLALSHPLYHMIGIAFKAVPLGDMAWRVNLISAIAAAVAAANIFLLLRMWFGRYLPAVVGAMTMAFSHTVWQHAAIAEVYTLHAAFLTTELVLIYCYFKYRRTGYLYWVALVSGLAISNHMFETLSMACYFFLLAWLLYTRQVRFRQVVIMAGLWIVGALPYEYLIVNNYMQTGDLAGTISSALFGKNFGGAVLNTQVTPRIVKENIMLFAMNYPTPNVLFFFAGLYFAFKYAPCRAWAVLLIAMTAVFYIFAFRYTVPDRYAFFISFYCMVPIFVGAGFNAVPEKFRKPAGAAAIVLSLLPIAVYYYLPYAAQKMHVNLGTKRTIPYRDDYKYFLRPWQCGNYGAQRFASESLNEAGRDSFIYADGTTVYALLYMQQVKGVRPDVKIIASHGSVRNMEQFDIDEIMKSHPVYVVSPVKGYIPQDWLDKYDFRQQGILWQMSLKENTR
jgi:hypothetical protein